jgi:hypothetical protein
MNVDKVEKKRETNGRLRVTLQYLPCEDRNNNNNANAETTSSESSNVNNNASAVRTESMMVSNYVGTDAAIRKGKEYTGVLYARIIRADALRAARGINPDPYVKIKFGKQKRKTKTKVDTRRPTWEEEFEFIVDTAESSRSAIEISVWDRAPLGRKQSLGTLRLHSGDILSQCLSVFKDTGAEFMEKKFELANVPCGTLLIQFEFISVSQAPALETDVKGRRQPEETTPGEATNTDAAGGSTPSLLEPPAARRSKRPVGEQLPSRDTEPSPEQSPKKQKVELTARDQAQLRLLAARTMPSPSASHTADGGWARQGASAGADDAQTSSDVQCRRLARTAAQVLLNLHPRVRDPSACVSPPGIRYAATSTPAGPRDGHLSAASTSQPPPRRIVDDPQ